MKRRPIRRVSAKRRAENAERDQNIPRPDGSQLCEFEGCRRRATDRHELLSRARGGSITDPANVRYLCRKCHRWITEHPAEALRLGWLRSAYEGEAG